jgi:catechol 2,3-dioxygenase-like lactoylglutathione lyase family enzyme
MWPLGHHDEPAFRGEEGVPMPDAALFKAAFPYQKDVLALPVTDLDAASQWYAKAFGLTEVERRDHPYRTVILGRDGVKIGFSINGGDASQDGAAILVSDIRRAKDELEANGIRIANWRIDERNGQKFQVFFVVAPDGLCFYFHQPI